MKNLILLLIACGIGAGLYAQSKQSSTLIGFQSGISSPFYVSNASIKNVKIGLPTFSYAASIEKRFSIHTKLNFSFQYSLNYYRLNREKAIETTYYLKNNSAALSSNVNINSYYSITKRSAVFAGVGIDQAVSSYFSKGSSSGYSTKSKTFGLKDFNPNLVLGIENNLKFFNTNLYYSLQYNIGFFPFSRSIRTETNEAAPQYFQGVRLGLKYKY